MIEARTRLSAPATVAVALWLDAWLRGEAASDDLLGVLASAAPDCPLRGAEPARSLDVLLGELRGRQVVAAWPVLPRPGRTLGWPRELPDEPTAAILLVGPEQVACGLLLTASAGWRLLPLVDGSAATALPLALLAEALPVRAALRRFTELLAEATRELSLLGLERRPTQPLPTRWTAGLAVLPPSCGPELVDLVHRTAHVLDALACALADHGAAVTAGEADARADHLRRLRDALTDLLVSAVLGARAGP